MRRWWIRVLFLLVLIFGFPRDCGAPLVYRPGEGWTYETPGSEGKWTRTRAKDQLEVAQQAFDEKKWSIAIKAARRVVKVYPLSDYAPRAQYLLGRTYEAKGNLERAFKEYQHLLLKYPKFDNYQEVLERQFGIATRYLGGKWFRLWGLVPLFPSMDRTAKMFDQIVNNGPYSPVAPRAQMNIGAAREKQSSFFNRVNAFTEAVQAYEKAADRYHDDREIAAEALYRAGLAYTGQSRKADYDQGMAGKAISTFSDFITLYPNDPRVADAQKTINSLRSEQARGNFRIAQYYEKRRRWSAAMIYYNETWVRDPSGPYAEEAKRRLDALKNRTATAAAAPSASSASTNAPAATPH